MKKVNQKTVEKFVDSLQTLQFYKKTKKAFQDVLEAMPAEDFKKATQNLLVVALHEGVMGQMMHFPEQNGKIKVMQLTLPQNAPIKLLRYVIAHELGHSMQGRNWKKSDGNKLEKNADEWAKKWGFVRDAEILEFQKKFWKDPKC